MLHGIWRASASGLFLQTRPDMSSPEGRLRVLYTVQELNRQQGLRFTERELLYSLFRMLASAVLESSNFKEHYNDSTELLEHLRAVDRPERNRKEESLTELHRRIFGDPAELEKRVLSNLKTGQEKEKTRQETRDYLRRHLFR